MGTFLSPVLAPERLFVSVSPVRFLFELSLFVVLHRCFYLLLLFVRLLARPIARPVRSLRISRPVRVHFAPNRIRRGIRAWLHLLTPPIAYRRRCRYLPLPSSLPRLLWSETKPSRARRCLPSIPRHRPH